MKTSLATSLSIIGVLATGGVAMAVNTTILDSTLSSVEETPAMAEANVPVSALSLDSATPAFLPNQGDAFPAVSEMIVTSDFNIEGVGVVTLEQSATGLAVASISPLAGWTYEDETESLTRIKIEFANGSQHVKFQAVLLDGRIVTAVDFDTIESNGTSDVSGEDNGDEAEDSDSSDDSVDDHEDEDHEDEDHEVEESEDEDD